LTVTLSLCWFLPRRGAELLQGRFQTVKRSCGQIKMEAILCFKMKTCSGSVGVWETLACAMA